MARLDDIPVEIKEMIWTIVAEDTEVYIAHKHFSGTPIKVPSVCGPTSAQAYSRESAVIISTIQLRKAVNRRAKIRINVLNFDFTNFIRFIKYYMAVPSDRSGPRSDVARLGITNPKMRMQCRHRITRDLDFQPAKLATWINFANTLHKKTGVRIGAEHALSGGIEDSPALMNLADTQTEFENFDGSQSFLIAVGLLNWRREIQWGVEYVRIKLGMLQFS